MRNFTSIARSFKLILFPVFFLLALSPYNIKAQCSGDVTLPVITSCPSSISDNNSPGFCGRNVSYGFVTATDNCQPAVNMPFNTEVHAVPSYTENGYEVLSTRRINVFNAVGVPNGPIIAPETLPATWTLSNVNDHTFTMTSLEMGAFNFTSNPQTNTFIGVRGDGSTVSHSFTATASYGSMELVTFPASFTNLVSMHWEASVTIYDNFRMVTLPKINRTSGLASGAFFPVGTTTVTYVAEDEAGNKSAPCTFTVTITDNEPPTFARPADKTIFTDANCNYNAAISNTGDVTNEHDNCGGSIQATFSDNITNGTCQGARIITRTWSLVDNHNNHAANQAQTITVLDNTMPVLTSLPFTLDRTLQCSDLDGIAAALLLKPTATDNCTAAPTIHLITNIITTDPLCPNAYTRTRTWNFTDACNNPSASFVQKITVIDNTPPTFTRPADKAIPFIGTCGYNATVANSGDVTDEADNCATGLNATFTDAVSQCGYNTIIMRTWRLMDNCGNAAADQVQTITVTDNNTSYIIYASSEAKFGEDNLINGDVGVTAANGKAEFKKGDKLDPYHVYAKNITVQMPAMVTNKHLVPAIDGPAASFFTYGGGGLSGNYTQNANGAVPAGNYKELTIKKGVTATVNGSNYGKIKIEEGADVTFTSGSIDMEELTVAKGKNNSTTNVHFTVCTGVRVKDKVTIEEDCRVNAGGPKVNIYLGDAKKDEENFSVKGDDTHVTLNIMIPNGKLKINGGSNNCIMTGWFKVEKLESDGKNVTWNKYGCTPPAALLSEPIVSARGEEEEVKELPVVTEIEKTKEIITETKQEVKDIVPVETMQDEGFRVNVYPNPSATDFSIVVTGKNSEPVVVRVIDLSGKVLNVISPVIKGSTIKLGAGLKAGTYFAEVTQGTNKQLVKLVKVK